jgi:hypothetical protein
LDRDIEHEDLGWEPVRKVTIPVRVNWIGEARAALAACPPDSPAHHALSEIVDCVEEAKHTTEDIDMYNAIEDDK